MSALIIETNKNAKLTIKDGVVRISNLITKESLEMSLGPNDILSTINLYKDYQAYQISVKEDYPEFLLEGGENLHIGDNGLYRIKRNNEYSFWVSTKEFKKYDFEKLPSRIKEGIISNIPKNGFWINTSPVFKREYLTGNEIITICNDFDVQNKSRLINIYEYIFILLKDKKTFEYFLEKIPKDMQRKPLLGKSTLIFINRTNLDNWPFIVKDNSSPIGYSLISYSEEDFFNFSKMYYRFCKKDNLFGNCKKYLPQLYAIGYDI